MSSASDYAFQTLLYVSRLVSEGDFKAAGCMGLSNEQMSKISDLSTQDIHVLSDLTQAKFLSVQFDQKALDKALVIIGDKKRHQHKIYELLREGASYPVMKYLYGLTTSDMANYKKFLNLPKSEGRPSLPSEDKQHNLWKHITHVDIHIKTEELADKLLHASKTTNLQINVIWLVLNKWDKDLGRWKEIIIQNNQEKWSKTISPTMAFGQQTDNTSSLLFYLPLLLFHIFFLLI